jgi:pilus assembly protein FimV
LIHHVTDFKEIEVTMKRKFYIVILLALAPTLVNALGLGNLDLNSALNEPFDARIQLLSPTADELDSLKVGLADSEAFARAKVDRPFILSKLKFALRRSVDDGPDYIRVFSQAPIREPFLNFLVEVSWSNGRLFREYTVLLDPPLYDPNARASEFTQATEQATEAVTIDDPDHKVVYADAFEQSTAPAYTPSVNYTGGDYGPTAGSDTLWSIASAMRPDTSISVNQMMLALFRANPDAFFNQNINGLKRGQILRMPNGSEINARTNAEALADVQSHYAAWDDIRDNLSGVVTERPEVSSVPGPSVSTSDEEIIPVEKVIESEPELKLVAAEDTGEATQQVSSVDSGAGEDLVLAQESIQALTQENLELNDRLQESEALLEDLKRLLSLKDDELAALQEQMAAQTEMAVEELEPVAEEIVSEVEEEVVPEIEEELEEVIEEEVEPVEEEMFAEEEMVAEEEIIEEEPVEEVVEVSEEEVIDVIETEPAPSSAGIMGMVDQYLGPVKEILLGNPMIGMGVAGVLIILIIIVVLMKFRKESAETVHIDAMTEEAFPDFDSGDLGDTGAEEPASEAVTVLPDSEVETAMPEESADFDLEEGEEAKTQFMAPEEEAPAVEEVEEESDEDPLQEVNTYLAFEQFDQAEEFVRNVINDDPDNPEFHTKLLEVFYTSGNKKSYEEAAKVLHDKVGGEGEHWNMAVAMWQEMSPSRALFEEGGDEEEGAAAETAGGGFVDVTADEEAGDDGAGLDFDIGGAEETPAAEEPAADAGDEMLDLTASDEGEDMLDVTAAVGLDDIGSEDETAEPVTAEDVLDISGSSAGSEDLLDITSGDESPGEDLLDVTAAANLDLDSEEDLLDVTAATSAGADSSELLDLEIETESKPDSEGLEFEAPSENETVEFDLGDTGEPEVSTEDNVESTDDNVIDFDMGSSESDDLEIEASEPEDAGLEIDLGVPEIEASEPEDAGLDMDLGVPEVEASEPEDAGLDMDLGVPEVEDEEPIRLDVEDDAEAKGDDEISLDLDMGDDGGIELDLSPDETDASPEIDLSIDATEEETVQVDAAELDFDIGLDDTPEESADSDVSLDLDGTVEIPKSVDVVDEDEDDDEHTVFVPRAAQPEEQSAEDEIATKLDLAKAYVELGDKDSAKTILDEVMAEGNDEQRKQAEDLLGQI